MLPPPYLIIIIFAQECLKGLYYLALFKLFFWEFFYKSSVIINKKNRECDKHVTLAMLQRTHYITKAEKKPLWLSGKV